MDHGTAILVRRIIAIALIALSLCCLFWPPMITLKSEYKEKLQDILPSDREAKESIEQKIDSLYEWINRECWEYRKETGEELPEFPIKQRNSEKDGIRAYQTVKDGALSVAETRTDVTMAANYAKQGIGYLDDVIDATDRELGRYSSYYYYSDYYIRNIHDEAERYRDQYEQYATLVRIASVGINILFFGMIVFGILAIVMMILNQMNFVPLHTALAVLCACAFAAVIIVGNKKLPEIYSGAPDDLLAPGVGLFLMPIFSIAACFVYKSDRVKKSTYQGAGQFDRAAQPWQPNLRYQEQQRQGAADVWTCMNCGTKNSADAAFCENCGGRKPVQQAPAQPRAAFCANCGKKIEPGTRFCPFCGTKQE